MSQTRPPKLIGDTVRFQVIGGRPVMTDIRARCQRSASISVSGSFRRDQTFIRADLNDRLWSRTAVDE